MEFTRVHQGDLQSRIVHYESERFPLQVALYGMFHFGEPSYYDDLSARFGTYDRVLVEALGHSYSEKNDTYLMMQTIANGYSLIAEGFALDTQDSLAEHPNYELCDFSMAEYEAFMVEHPQERTELQQMQQAVGLQFISYLTSGFRRQELISGCSEDIVEVPILEVRRERKVMDRLRDLFFSEENCAVQYGAGHMRRLDRYLRLSSFTPKADEWVTVVNQEGPN